MNRLQRATTMRISVLAGQKCWLIVDGRQNLEVNDALVLT